MVSWAQWWVRFVMESLIGKQRMKWIASERGKQKVRPAVGAGTVDAVLQPARKASGTRAEAPRDVDHDLPRFNYDQHVDLYAPIVSQSGSGVSPLVGECRSLLAGDFLDTYRGESPASRLLQQVSIPPAS